MVLNRSLGFAMVGGGEGATKATSALAGFEIWALKAVVCQPDELVGLIDPKLRTNRYRDVLSRSDVEAIYIATPNNSHVPLALEAIQARKHVLIEKPLGVSVADAMALRGKVPPGLVSGVAFKKRFGKASQVVKQTIAELGNPLTVSYVWQARRQRPSWYYDSAASGGGVVVDLGSHVFDLLEYLLGEIEEVDARLQMSPIANDIEDGASMSLRFRSGVKGEVHLDWSSEAPNQKLSFKFDSAYVTVERVRPQLDMVRCVSGAEGTEHFLPTSSEYRGLVTAFSQAVRNGQEAVPSVRDALRNLHVIEAVYRSARSGQPICPPVS